MKDTRLAFVVGPGRSGTALLGQRFFPAVNDLAPAGRPLVEARHEYHCELLAEAGVHFYLQRSQRTELARLLERLHGAAARFSEAPLWVDVSNKLAWVLPVLVEAFPRARYVHLIRDGLATVTSFYWKLKGEAYTDHGVLALRQYFEGSGPTPPLAKEYWWPRPRPDDPYRPDFDYRWGRWERLCWYWAETGREVERGLSGVPDGRKLLVRLEDLAGDGGVTGRELCGFLGLPWDDALLGVLARRHNVIESKEHYPTWDQRDAFFRIAGRVQADYYGDRAAPTAVIEGSRKEVDR